MESSKSSNDGGGRATPFATLRRFATSKGRLPEPERCELCSVTIPPEHRHLLETATRRIVCSCDPCALRFDMALDGRFKLIPRDARSLPDFRLSDAQWEELALPIELVFMTYSTPAKRMLALYPSPAGATESLLTLGAWDSIVAENPVLGGLTPDVEALLVNRARGKRLYYIAPIDTCFELVGLMRTRWRGFTGGDEVWREIDRYFEKLAAKSRPAREVAHA